jgi:hypothetical protein
VIQFIDPKSAMVDWKNTAEMEKRTVVRGYLNDHDTAWFSVANRIKGRRSVTPAFHSDENDQRMNVNLFFMI